MFKKIIILGLMFLYLYTLIFNIFMTSVLKIPSPLVFGLPLIFFFKESKSFKFGYAKELFVFLLASIVLYLFAQEDVKTFLVVMIITSFCAAYFNYFIGDNMMRFKQSVWMFFGLLTLSSICMLLNHLYEAPVIALRSMLIGEIVKQTPSGISTSIFTFGYQLAALVTFVVIAASAHKKHFLIQLLAFGFAVVLIFYGMNRSVFVVFAACVGLFWLFYYRFKTIVIFSVLIGLSVLLKSSIADLSTGRKQNILVKNASHVDEHRSSLMIENLKIIADYPFGLAFSGKEWDAIAMRNPVFRIGEKGLVTSHNAYLMFITYIGIVLGGIFIWLMYHKVLSIFFSGLRYVRKPENAFIVSLCFSFAAVSINAFFHNEWLLLANGPTVFLYFSVLHLTKIQNKDK